MYERIDESFSESLISGNVNEVAAVIHDPPSGPEMSISETCPVVGSNPIAPETPCTNTDLSSSQKDDVHQGSSTHCLPEVGMFFTNSGGRKTNIRRLNQLESLIPWILQLLHLHQKQQYEIKTMKQYNEQLKQQLESIKTNTIKQINEMAKHINNLTEELQIIRLNSLTNHHSHNSFNKEQQQSNCLSLHSNDNQVKKVSNIVITVVVIIVSLFT
ncbi:unnamed protein product [Schistosoma mattheei]|uniref:Uncharacterized protein n=1 Tax=Schistosoma mattheei TaxID=31246 RepID=A0A183PWJ9_9TREM|nr:unnamed protein product [Schistosoma mattheei]